jgi:hypothetical protein
VTDEQIMSSYEYKVTYDGVTKYRGYDARTAHGIYCEFIRESDEELGGEVILWYAGAPAERY